MKLQSIAISILQKEQHRGKETYISLLPPRLLLAN